MADDVWQTILHMTCVSLKLLLDGTQHDSKVVYTFLF